MRSMHRSVWVLAMALAEGFCAAPTSRAGDVVKLLPAETEVVVSCNVTQLLESPLLLKIAALPSAVGSAKKAFCDFQPILNQIQFLGLDLKDVACITCAGKVGPTPIKVIEGIVIFEGSFDRDRLKAAGKEAAANGGSFTITSKDGTEVWECATRKKPNVRVYTALVDAKTLVFTSTKSTIEAVLKQRAKNNVALEDSMAALLAKPDVKRMIGCVIKGKCLADLIKDHALPVQVQWSAPGVGRLARDRRAIRAGLTSGANTSYTLSTIAESPEAAKKLRRRVNRLAAIGTIVLTSLDDESLQPWEDLVRGMRATAEGAVVTLRGPFTSALLEKVLSATRP
jgi:hypothetical protein